MKSYFYHVQINISFERLTFYRELMELLGWLVIFEMDDVIGFKSDKNGDIWFTKTKRKETSDYDNLGVNHVSIRVERSGDIDEVVKFLKAKGVELLFDTPRHRPEFSSSESETYYQVMFKHADNVLFEIVYVGVK